MKNITSTLFVLPILCHAAVIQGTFTQTTYIDVNPEFPSIEDIRFVYDTESNVGALYGRSLIDIFGENRIEFTVEGADTTTFEAITDFNQCAWKINEQEFAVRGRYDETGFFAYIPFSSNGNYWYGSLKNIDPRNSSPSGQPNVGLVATRGFWGAGIELEAVNLLAGTEYTVQASKDLIEWKDYEDIIAIGINQSWYSDLVPYWENETLEEIRTTEPKWFFRLKEKGL